MKYALLAALTIVVAAFGYGFGYVDAYRQWATLDLETARLTELDRARHLLRLAERIDTGDVPGARLRMVAVSSVGLNNDAFGLSSHISPSVADVLLERFGDHALSARTAAFEAQNRRLETELRSALMALCSAPAASGSDYNGACRR